MLSLFLGLSASSFQRGRLETALARTWPCYAFVKRHQAGPGIRADRTEVSAGPFSNIAGICCNEVLLSNICTEHFEDTLLIRCMHPLLVSVH